MQKRITRQIRYSHAVCPVTTGFIGSSPGLGWYSHHSPHFLHQDIYTSELWSPVHFCVPGARLSSMQLGMECVAGSTGKRLKVRGQDARPGTFWRRSAILAFFQVLHSGTQRGPLAFWEHCMRGQWRIKSILSLMQTEQNSSRMCILK